MAKKSKEEIERIKIEKYYDNLFHFINALHNCGFYWKDISQEICKNGLFIHKQKTYNKKKKKTEIGIITPNIQKFWDALRKCGVERRWFSEKPSISEILAMDVLNRAKIITKYNKIFPPEDTDDENALPDVIIWNDDAVMELELMCGFDSKEYYELL